MKHLWRLSYSHNYTKHLLSTPLGLLCAKAAILDKIIQQRPCSDVLCLWSSKIVVQTCWVSQYASHQPKAGAGTLTFIMFRTQCHSSRRTKLDQWARTNLKNKVLLKHSMAEIQMLQCLSSSDHNINYCTMFTKWATTIPDQNQTYNKILSSKDKQDDKLFLDAPRK